MSRPPQTKAHRRPQTLPSVLLTLFFIGCLLASSGAQVLAQDPSPEKDVEVLVADLERSLADPELDKSRVDRAVVGLESLLEKAESGDVVIPDALRFKALVMLTRAGVRKIKRVPSVEETDATHNLLNAVSAPLPKADKAGSGVRTLRRRPAVEREAEVAQIPLSSLSKPSPQRVVTRVERPAVKPLPAPTRVEAAAKVPQRATKVVKVKRAEVKRVEVKRVEVKKKRPGAKAKHFVFAWPVKKARVTSRFGMRRHPKLKRRKMHKGTDFGGPKGKRVHATGPGKVLRAGRGGGGVGIHVVIEHPGGWTSRYFHLSKVDVKAGATVRRGQLIGRVGSTGRSTGPHLHFQVEYKGKAINPERLIGRRSDKVRRPRR